MINICKSGFDPNGHEITPDTTDVPGFFLTEEMAYSTIREAPNPGRYDVLRKTVSVGNWRLHIWVTVLKVKSISDE